MTNLITPNQTGQDPEYTHIDVALQAHKTRLHKGTGTRIGLVLGGIIALIGFGAAAITLFSPELSTSDSPYAVSTGSAESATQIPTPTPDPNANLPEPIKAAINLWPTNRPHIVHFKLDSSVPGSIEDSEAIYEAVVDYTKKYTGITVSVTAYTTASEPARNLAALRLEYVASQLVENGLARHRMTLSTQEVTEYPTADYADLVHVTRSLFEGESFNQ